MKKIILLLCCLANFSFSFVCSSTLEEGGPGYIAVVFGVASAEFGIVSGMWGGMKLISSQIQSESKKKQQYLENIAKLSRANALKEQKVRFEFEKFKNLLGVSIDIEGTK